ncbi:MAG: vWA domain-containing protein [Neptuniibacter sp.]
MKPTKDITRLLDRAKIKLMQNPNSTFITTVLFSLKFSWDQSIPTACTNGLTLQFNPDWFQTLSEDERVGVLVHEAWHVAFQHMTRVDDKDFQDWNIATDYVINNMLDDKGYSLPEGGCLDHQYDDMTSEQVYDKIHNDQNHPGRKNFQPDMKDMSGSAQSQLSKDQAQQIQSQIEDIVIKAHTQAQMAQDDPGSIPGEIQLAIDKLLNPKLPWYEILNRYMNGLAPEDYSFRKFNRRFLPDFYLPTLYSEALGEITVAVDTSGSITDEQFLEFVTEIDSIQRNLKPEKTTVIDFDTSIKAIHELNDGEDVRRIQFTGRGGTDIKEVLEWGKENKPNALVIFTDGYFYKHDIDPEIPVIWVIHSGGYGNFDYPFGKIIEYPD